MPRKARERSATGCYHIMGRGINHAAICNDDADNMNFLHILDFCADEDFTIFAYCLMGNHFHLLAKADADVLQHVMPGKFSLSNPPFLMFLLSLSFLRPHFRFPNLCSRYPFGIRGCGLFRD